MTRVDAVTLAMSQAQTGGQGAMRQMALTALLQYARLASNEEVIG
jgi:hypothetical protein